MYPGAAGSMCPSQSSENWCPGHQLHQAEQQGSALESAISSSCSVSCLCSCPFPSLWVQGSWSIAASGVRFAICDE